MGIPAPLGVAAAGLPNKGDAANAVVIGIFSAIGPGDPFAFRGPMNVAIWASINTALTTTKGSLSASVASGTSIAAGNAIDSVNVPPGTTWGAFSGTSGTLALPAVTLLGRLNTSNNHVTLPPGSNVARLLGATVTLPSNAENASIPASTTVTAIIQADVAPTSDPPYSGIEGIIQLSNIPTLAPPTLARIPLRFAVTANAILTSGADSAALFTGAAISYSGTVQVEYSFDGGATWLVANAGGGGTLAQYTAGTPVRLTFGEPERQVLYRLNCIAYTSGVINYRISTTGAAAESLAIATSIG